MTHCWFTKYSIRIIKIRFDQPRNHVTEYITIPKYRFNPPLTWASAPQETSVFKVWENASPVIQFWWPLSLVLTCKQYSHFLSIFPKPDTIQESLRSSSDVGHFDMTTQHGHDEGGRILHDEVANHSTKAWWCGRINYLAKQLLLGQVIKWFLDMWLIVLHMC